VGQFQEPTQPIEFGQAVVFDGDPGISTANDRTDRDGDDVEQVMLAGPLQPRVFQGGKVRQQRAEFPCGHGAPPCEKDGTRKYGGTGGCDPSSHCPQTTHFGAIALMPTPVYPRRNFGVWQTRNRCSNSSLSDGECVA